MFRFCFAVFLKCYIVDVVALCTGFGTWAGSEDGCSSEQTGKCHLGQVQVGNGISCDRWERSVVLRNKPSGQLENFLIQLCQCI